jgi:glycosidase
MEKSILLILAATILFSCGKKVENAPEKSEIIGLASPVQLGIDSTVVYLTDYFVDPQIITDVVVPEHITKKRDHHAPTMTLYHDNGKLPLFAVMTVKTAQGWYSILLKNSKKQKITFSHTPKATQPKRVQIAGEVNNWNPAESDFILQDGTWSLTMWLNPGKYHYQLVLDGKWVLDPENSDIEDNNIGGKNSVVRVPAPDADKLPYLFVDKPVKGKIQIGYVNRPEQVFVFWDNVQLDNSFLEFGEAGLTITIPCNAKKADRSHIRVWAMNQHGSLNDLLIPLEKGCAVTKSAQLKRSDKHTQILYFLMVDRFYNGNPENDKPVDDPEILPQANYMGGDLAGVTKKIEDGYFSSLGINTVWLSPITQNPLDAWGLWPNPRTKFSGYHGYWPISLSKVDFRFGTSGELSTLLNKAHSSEMNVLLDYVANHVHKDHPAYVANPSWATPLYLPDGTMNTEKWDEHRLTTWFDTFLPTLDLERPEIYETMTDSALFWLTQFPFDGFRHDATKHIPEVFWRRLTQKIKTALPEKSIYQIGETYGSRELIGSYIGSGMMDAQFDFNLYDAALATFAKKDSDFKSLNASVLESMNYYGSLHLMGNMTGNQDKPRFLSLASGDVRFDEDTKLAGWTRDIGVSDTLAYRKLQLMNAFNLTVPGIPTLYYGDEIGMPGGNDPDNRRMMKFENLNTHETQTLETVKAWIHLRRTLLPLQYGTFKPLVVEKEIYAFVREYMGQAAVVVFNKSTDRQKVSISMPAHLSKKEATKTEGLNQTFSGSTLEMEIGALSVGLVVLE